MPLRNIISASSRPARCCAQVWQSGPPQSSCDGERLLPWINTNTARRTIRPMARTSCRASERAAKLAILNLASEGSCSDAARIKALTRLAELIYGCVLEIEARQPTPPKTDPPEFEPVFI